jgi:ABC-type molybdate transport system substrate-binding protein
MNAAVAVLLVLLSVNQSGPAHAQAPRRRLTVAAACDLKFAFEELNRQWSSQGI